jgi:hypothetical protein
MVKCNSCKTIYEEKQRQHLIKNKFYICAFCHRFKIFNPFDPRWFEPEVKAIDVFNWQKSMYESGKRNGEYRN